MKLPPEIFAQHIAVLGKTRSGKSSVMRLCVEDLLEGGKPVCIVDPKGDWWGLKSSADGGSKGYPVVIFGGEHADIPINAKAGGYVAELASVGNRPSIIDLGGWMVGERTRFFIDFASGLFRSTKGHRWLVIDEVHNFAPQGKVLDPDAGKMLHWTNRLASEGLGKGLAIIAASQRPQKVHKDFLTCAETLIAMRVIHPLDRGAIKDWMDGCPDAAKGKEVLGSLASMPRGEGWVWSPEIDFGPKRIAFPMFKTYDSFRSRGGDPAIKLKGWAEINLDEVRKKMASIVEEMKANDPAELKARIRELEQNEATKRRSDGATKRDDACLADARAVAKELRCRFQRFNQMLGIAESTLQRAMSSFNGLGGDIARLRVAVDETPGVADAPVEHRLKTVGPSPTTCPLKPRTSNRSLSKGETLVLTAVAQHPSGTTAPQLTQLTGYKRSSRDTYLQRLHAAGKIERDGNRWVTTDEGVRALGAEFQPLPTGAALREYWLERLPLGERLILQEVVRSHPAPIDNEELSKRSGYARSSRDTFVQRLAARHLVVRDRGLIRAAEELFD